MSYHVRTFCTSSELPQLSAVIEWISSHKGIQLSADLDPEGWVDGYIHYDPDRQPLVVEADTGELLRDEIAELVDELADLNDSPQRERVLNHIRSSRAVVAVQLLGDINDQGYEALSAFVAYYVENCGGLVHAQDEGFYEGDQVILELA